MKNRSSNFELLRIIAMLMIIAYHIYCHCVNVQLTDVNLIDKLDNGWFCYPHFYKRLLIVIFVSPMGKIGNEIFILISGYFMVSKVNDINIVKITKKLLLQQGFAAINLVVGSFILYRIIQPSFKVSMLNINFFNGMSWFVGYYFLVVLIAFLFLNKYIDSIGKNDYQKLLIILFAFTQLSWAGSIVNNLAGGMVTLVTGLFLYSLGGYIRKYEPFSAIRTYVIFLVIIIANLFIFISAYNDVHNAISNYESGTFIQKLPDYADNGIIPIIIGVSLFELFRRISVPQNKIINYLGGATFMVYLLHDNGFAYSIWLAKDWITLMYESPYKYMVEHTIYTIATFAIGVLIYTAYVLICKICSKSVRLVLKDNI